MDGDFRPSAREDVAANALKHVMGDNEISAGDIQRWTTLFKLSPPQAKAAIMNWRQNQKRETISLEAWELVKDRQALDGFDKESYEYALDNTNLQRRSPQEPPAHPERPKVAADEKSRFLLKLEKELADPEAVQTIGSLRDPPARYHDADNDAAGVNFCIVDAAGKGSILKGLADQGSTLVPFFVRVPQAKKSQSPATGRPSLGIDATMTEHRPSHNRTRPAPGQDEFPVWYFFCGTLANPKVLARVLHRDHIQLKPAREHGVGQYCAMTHAVSRRLLVSGYAYLVQTPDEEDELRVRLRQLQYEVVSCRMEIVGRDKSAQRTVDGLTFIFVG